ncbi:MAG: hypothetical protein POELPBGB_04179 [Bacteroidia bacterium]|nr:hypothetical protein [Bacteroidia bacterium]
MRLGARWVLTLTYKSTQWLRWQELYIPVARGESIDSGCWARHLRFEPSAQDVILLQQSSRGACEVAVDGWIWGLITPEAFFEGAPHL